MLLCPEYRVVNVTLHLSLQEALHLLSTQLIEKAIRAGSNALQKAGLSKGKIGVCGLNPHAGEGGLFGREDDAMVRPAVENAKRDGVNVIGPIGADALFGNRGCDAYIALYHDQGHIPIKVAAPNIASAVSIGTPVVFGSVAHGSAYDIVGKGIAKPDALLNAVKNLRGMFAV